MRRVLAIALALTALQLRGARVESERVRFTVRCTETTSEGTRTLYQAAVEGEPSTDFDIALRDPKFELQAFFVNEPSGANAVDVRLRVESRRLHGTSPAGLPLWEEARQQHRLTVGFDQQLDLLPFGGAGPRGLVKFEILPDRANGSGGPKIAITEQQRFIAVRAYRVPHWFVVEAVLERGGVVAARGSARAFQQESAHIAVGDIARLDVTASTPQFQDPWSASALHFDGRWSSNRRAFAQGWGGTTTGRPMSYALDDGWTLKIGAHPETEKEPEAFAVMAEIDRIARQSLWPEFDPARVPVAIFDGERTLLFRHPAPPQGFVPLGDGVFAFDGRHPAVTANSATELAGVLTATVMPDREALSRRERAALTVHEMFHVYQRSKHPKWIANEAALFTYPADDAMLVSMQRMEAEALRRALMENSACWAREAIKFRETRFARMPKDAALFERMTELNEGLATYVQHRAIGTADAQVMPAAAFAPEAVRRRAYATGHTIARLLDRYSPSWRETLEQQDDAYLDAMLAGAVRGGDTRCGFRSREKRDIQSRARADVAALTAQRAEKRAAFLVKPGFRIVITAEGAPLMPMGFDPSNVLQVAPGEILHSRFLKLGGNHATIEIIGRPSLSVAAGEHPLFNGVRMLTITGFTDQPRVTEAAGALQITAEGLTATLRDATMRKEGTTIYVSTP